MFSLKSPSNAIFTLFLLVFFLQVFHFASADLLCRNCGHLVTTAPALKNVMSPRAIEHWNLTVLGVETVVQVFKNSVPETFNLITANGADLKFSGKSYAEDTWFPGMRWTPCVCSSCSSHIGWYFEAQKDDFVGLVLDYLISSECKFMAHRTELQNFASPPILSDTLWGSNMASTMVHIPNMD